MATFWNLLKALIYISALLFLIGGGLCAVTTAFIPLEGTGQIAIVALLVMLVGFGVMKWVGRPSFSAGSPGEAILYLVLLLFFGMPAIQAVAYMIGLGTVGPFLSFAALAAVIFFFVRRHKARATQPQPARESPPSEPPPQT